MQDFRKPVSYEEMCRKELFFFRLCSSTSGFMYLPVEIFLHSQGYRISGGIPRIDVKLGDYIYNISIAKKPKILTEIPSEYYKEVDEVIKFVSCNYDILIDHWNDIIDDCDLIDVFRGRTSYKAFNGKEWV